MPQCLEVWAASWDWPVWYSIPPKEVLAQPTEGVLGTWTSGTPVPIVLCQSPSSWLFLWPRFARPPRLPSGPLLFPPLPQDLPVRLTTGAQPQFFLALPSSLTSTPSLLLFSPPSLFFLYTHLSSFLSSNLPLPFSFVFGGSVMTTPSVPFAFAGMESQL